MGYSVYEDIWHPGRWAGYGVPAECDFPDCTARIDRGFAYKCDEHSIYDEHQDEYILLPGCEHYFCLEHRENSNLHENVTAKPDLDEWIWWILVSPSWREWRDNNPLRVDSYRYRLEDSSWRPGRRDLENLHREMEEVDR
jgi:hypothetical protein